MATPPLSLPSVKLVRFPSIEPPEKVFQHLIGSAQFVRYDKRTKTSIYDPTLTLPILTLRGTVKIHGANCSIVQTRISKDVKVTHFQSRNKVLSLEQGKDYMGFNTHMDKHMRLIDTMFKGIFSTRQKTSGKQVTPDDISSIAIFGEWCGGTIQKDIALSQFETMFIIFGIKIIYTPGLLRRKPDELIEWMDVSLVKQMHNETARIFNTHQFTTYEVTVDLAKDQSIEDCIKLMEKYTLEVQDECPVAKKLGASSVSRNGEGIVWQVTKLATRPTSARNPNLKLEKFSSPGCWMKTRDSTGDVAAELLRLKKKQNIANAVNWRREDQLETPELAFVWEEAAPETPETPGTPRRSMPALRVGVTWSAGRSPRDTAENGMKSPETALNPNAVHAKAAMSINITATKPTQAFSNAESSDSAEPLSAAYLNSRPHFTDSKAPVPRLANFLEFRKPPVSTFTIFGPPLAANLVHTPSISSLGIPQRSSSPDMNISIEQEHENKVRTKISESAWNFSKARLEAPKEISIELNTPRSDYDVGTSLIEFSDDEDLAEMDHSETGPIPIATKYKYEEKMGLPYKYSMSAPIKASKYESINPAILKQLDELAVKQVPINYRSDAIFNVYGSVESLANFVTSESRLQQGLHEMDNEWNYQRHVHSVGPFVEWVIKDAFKEQSHRINPAGYNHEEVAAAIGSRASRWYLNHLPKQWWAQSAGLGDRIEE